MCCIEHRDGELFVTATDLEMQITARAALPGKESQAVTVAARKLQDLLRALPEDATLNVDAAGSKMTVRAGRSRFNLQTLPAADYPRIGVGQDQVQQLSLPQRDLRSLIKAAEFAMAQQDIRYYLNGMLLVIDQDSLQAVATDGHRLSWASLKVEGDYQRREVILPRKTVLELGKLLADADDPVAIDVLTNQVRFAFGGIELVSKVVDGNVEVVGREQDERVRAAELENDLLQVAATDLGDRSAGALGAGERDALHARVGDDLLDLVVRGVDVYVGAGREPRVQEDLLNSRRPNSGHSSECLSRIVFPIMRFGPAKRATW